MLTFRECLAQRPAVRAAKLSWCRCNCCFVTFKRLQPNLLINAPPLHQFRRQVLGQRSASVYIPPSIIANSSIMSAHFRVLSSVPDVCLSRKVNRRYSFGQWQDGHGEAPRRISSEWLIICPGRTFLAHRPHTTSGNSQTRRLWQERRPRPRRTPWRKLIWLIFRRDPLDTSRGEVMQRIGWRPPRRLKASTGRILRQ